MSARFAITYQAAKALAGTGDAGDRRRAMDMLQACADRGHAPAQSLLAGLLLEDAEPATRAAAVDLLRQAAEAGHAEAQHRLGAILARGGAAHPSDLAQAADWCRRAADQGHGPAQFDLALLHASGSGVPADIGSATRWLRQAAAQGVEEASACLDLVVGDGDGRPRGWDDAETRVSVILTRSGPQAAKTTRFAEYYVDPCVNLLVERYRLVRDQAEDIVQQFFVELEEPLAKGAHRGRPWKEALRAGWDPQRGDFRPYLRRTLVNFARDWMRRQAAPRAGGGPSAPDLAAAAADRSACWRPLLAAFAADHAGHRPPAPRAAQVVRLVLEEDLAQDDLARRFQVTDRTIRNDCRLGADLLRSWLEHRLAALGAPADPRRLDLLRQGLSLIPDWLHHPGVEKRLKALVFLALAAALLDQAA